MLSYLILKAMIPMKILKGNRKLRMKKNSRKSEISIISTKVNNNKRKLSISNLNLQGGHKKFTLTIKFCDKINWRQLKSNHKELMIIGRAKGERKEKSKRFSKIRLINFCHYHKKEVFHWIINSTTLKLPFHHILISLLAPSIITIHHAEWLT